MPANNPPVRMAMPLSLPQATAGAVSTSTVSGWAGDSDLGDSLRHTLISGPAWLHIEPSTGHLSGTPQATDIGQNVWTLRATDLAGASVTSELRIFVYGPLSYTEWAATMGLTGATAHFDADHDADGLKNGLEFVLGGQADPQLPGSDSAALLPKARMENGMLRYSFQRKRSSIGRAGLLCQWSDNLSIWPPANEIPLGDTSATHGPVNVTITPLDADTDNILVTFPGAMIAAQRLFIGLQVSSPP